MQKIIIAIDGFSSTGKSTVAKQLAEALNYIYLDTGAMYRAVTLFALRKGFISEEHLDGESLIKKLDDIDLDFRYNTELGFAEMFLNGENVEETIRQMEVSQYVSRVAEVPQVRAALVRQQQLLGKEKGIVMDGRDIGTVVFPDAELKLFMNASAETRAQRRFEELTEKGDKVSYKQVYENIKQRDNLDTSREDSPLLKADDAVEIDNSNLSREEQFDKILAIAKKRIAKN